MTKREEIAKLREEVGQLRDDLKKASATTSAVTTMFMAAVSVLKMRGVLKPEDAAVIVAAGSEVHKRPRPPAEVLKWATTPKTTDH